MLRLGCACLIPSSHPLVTESLDAAVGEAAATRAQKRPRWYAAEEKLNCFVIGGASGRRFTSVAAAAYSA